MSIILVKQENIAFRSQTINVSSRTFDICQIYSTKEFGLLLECDRPTINYDIQKIINDEIFLNLKLCTRVIKFINYVQI